MSEATKPRQERMRNDAPKVSGWLPRGGPTRPCFFADFARSLLGFSCPVCGPRGPE